MVHQSSLPSAQAANKPERLPLPATLHSFHAPGSLAAGQALGDQHHQIHLCHPPRNGRRVRACTFKRF